MSPKETNASPAHPSQQCFEVFEKLLAEMAAKKEDEQKKTLERIKGLAPAAKAKLIAENIKATKSKKVDTEMLDVLDDQIQKELILASIEELLAYVEWKDATREQDLAEDDDDKDDDDDDDEEARDDPYVSEFQLRNERASHASDMLKVLFQRSHKFSYDEILYLLYAAGNEHEPEVTSLPMNQILSVVEHFIKTNGRDHAITQKLTIVVSSLEKYAHESEYRKMLKTANALLAM